MKKVKITLIIMMIALLFAMPITTLAVDDEFDIMSDPIDLNGGSTTTPETPTTPTTPETPETPTTTPTQPENDLPKTGIADNTIMVVAIILLSIGAIIAYKKTNYYKNV